MILPRSLVLAALLPAVVAADAGEVLSDQKISATQGGLVSGPLEELGHAVARLDDMDGDGVPELAVGEPYGDVGGTDRGAVWILFLAADGTVKSQQPIRSGVGGFTGVLDDGDEFGQSLAFVGDLDGDGVGDLAVGAPEDDDGGTARGAVWILFLESDGTVAAHQKISATQGNLSPFAPALDDFDRFGSALAWMGDFDGDGLRPALAVGVPFDDDGATLEDTGATYVLFMNPNGTVSAKQKISPTAGNFQGAVEDYDWFGSSVAYLGDHDGDGVGDLAVGALRDDDGGSRRGAVYVLRLFAGGTVKAHQKISSTAGGFTGDLDDVDEFGTSVAALGDVDGDGLGDLAVGAGRHADGGPNRGGVWILFLDAAGAVLGHQKISDNAGGFDGFLQNFDVFGASLGALGDLDGDGRTDLAVGAIGDDDGGPNYGAVWMLFLDGVAPASAQSYGCGPNPPGSLELVGGVLPTPGATVQLGLANPLGTQGAGAATALLAALGPWPAYPCGLPVAGLGMSAPGASGELLVDPGQLLQTLVGPPWPGPATQAVVSIPIPSNPAFLGLELFFQGLLHEPGGAVETGLTEGLVLRIGT